jgi:DNA-binding PadR family transcriptional regulator
MAPRAKALRMTPTYFHVMLSLVGPEQHGYAIMQEVERRTGGTLKLGPGSLYWALNRLVQAGYIEEEHHRPAEGDDERRRYYRLTELGGQVLQRETRILADIVEHAREQAVLEESGS